MNRLRKGNRAQSGFTLAESLIAMLILMMVSVIVAAGVPSARNAYEKIVIKANAQVGLSTAVSALRDELGSSRKVDETPDGGADSITYYSSRTGRKSKISLKEENDPKAEEIWIDDYVHDDDYEDVEAAGYDKSRPLVSRSAMNKNLYITYDNVTYNKSERRILFTNLAVYRRGVYRADGKPLASIAKLDVYLVTP